MKIFKNYIYRCFPFGNMDHERSCYSTFTGYNWNDYYYNYSVQKNEGISID